MGLLWGRCLESLFDRLVVLKPKQIDRILNWKGLLNLTDVPLLVFDSDLIFEKIVSLILW